MNEAVPERNDLRRRPITKTRIFVTALLVSTAVGTPALAQDQTDHSQMDHSGTASDQAQPDAAPDAAADMQTDATADMSADTTAEGDAAVDTGGIPVEQRNAAIEGFTQAQTAQASGDFAGAVAALSPHLDTIRAMAAASGDAQSAGFLADALTTVAVSQAQTGDVSAVAPLLQEAVPARRMVYEASPGDMNARMALVNSLNSTGNVMLQTADKPTAEPYFKEAADLAKEGYDADPANGAVGNAYLTAAIGMNNVTADPEWYAKVKTIATALNTAGTLDPSLAPVVQPLIGG